MVKKFLKQLNFPESYISITLGFLVVVAGGLLLYRSIINKNTNTSQAPKNENDITFQEQNSGEKVELPTNYTVMANDNLWNIAEKFYGSGYNWVSLVKENNIKNQNKIEVGQILNIPKAKVIKPENEKIMAVSTEIMKSYTVVRGDSLWKIALQVYGDGYAWTKIAKANNLVNPSLIHPGNIFKLPN